MHPCRGASDWYMIHAGWISCLLGVEIDRAKVKLALSTFLGGDKPRRYKKVVFLFYNGQITTGHKY